MYSIHITLFFVTFYIKYLHGKTYFYKIVTYSRHKIYKIIAKNYHVLICIILGTGVVSCNHGDGLKAGLQENASKSNRLLQELDNVPRAFAIGKLKKLEIIPEVPEKEGTVIGIVTEDRGIVCMNEDVIKQLSRPILQQHVDQYMPAYRDFQIAATDFLLFKDGVLLLAFAIVSEQDAKPRKIYIALKMQETRIILPRQAPTTYSCSATSCPSHCRVAGRGIPPNHEVWCQCQSSGYGKNAGCKMNISH